MIAIDATDARLLDLLQADASLSNQALADAAHVSAPTAFRRVRRLVESGLIERHTALVSLREAGGLNAIVEITLDRQGDEHAQAFESLIVKDDAVQQCYRVTAGPDFIVMLWVADMSDYQAVVSRLFTQHANVRTVKTFFATHRAKFDPRIKGSTLLAMLK